MTRQEKWDKRFLELAQFISKWSLDPSTQTGAVIVDKDLRIISTGYNGLPKGVEDTKERLNNRELKYRLVVHCETNAILFARTSLVGCTLYTYPFMSCSTCTGLVIQSGIVRCVAPTNTPERWKDNCEISKQMLKEAGVELTLYD